MPGTGHDIIVVAGQWSYRKGGLVLAALLLLLLQNSSGASWLPFLAANAMLVFGLPHGALDLALLRKVAGAGQKSTALMLFAYLGLAGFVYLIWLASPAVALAGFLVIAAFHFAEDWADDLPPIMALGSSIAVLTAPALLHRSELVELFGPLLGASAQPQFFVDVMTLIAPLATAVAVAGVVVNAKATRTGRALETSIILAAMITLSPVVGFALYFTLSHSPVHFSKATLSLGSAAPARWEVAGLTLAALALAFVVLVTGQATGAPTDLISSCFVVLSMLTLPHLAMPSIVARTLA